MDDEQIKINIDKMLEFLNPIYDEYSILNKETRGRFNFRQNSIELQISILQALKDGFHTPLEDWELCLAEDKYESKFDK